MCNITYPNFSPIGSIVFLQSCQPGEKTLFREKRVYSFYPEKAEKMHFTFALKHVFRAVLEISSQNNTFYSISIYVRYKNLYFLRNRFFEKKLGYYPLNHRGIHWVNLTHTSTLNENIFKACAMIIVVTHVLTAPEMNKGVKQKFL